MHKDKNRTRAPDRNRKSEKRGQKPNADDSAALSASPRGQKNLMRQRKHKDAEQTAQTHISNHEPFESILDAEQAAITSDSRLAKILDRISKRLKFKPGQILLMPLPQALPYLLTGFLGFFIQTLSMNMFQNNLPQLQAHYQASLVESIWFLSAYMAPYASFSVLLIKVRVKTGVRRSTFMALFCFIVCSALETQISDYNATLFMRFLSGLTTAPLSSIAIFYTVEPFVPARKVTIGMSLCMMYTAMGMPFARLIAPYLVADDGVAYFYLFMMGLACVAVFLVHFLQLKTPPTGNPPEKLDFISFPLFALGLGLNAAILPLGKYYWWQDAAWIGVVYVISIFSLTCFLLIELHRKTPLIDLRWLFSRDMLHITLVMLTFRILVSDQSSIINMYFSMFNLQNDQLVTLYAFVALGILAGGILCCVTLKPGGGDHLYLLGAAAIAIGSYADSFSTNLTRPSDMYVTQMLIGFGTALFMAVSFSKGFLAAITGGKPHYITSFIAVFLFTQSTGGLAGSAFFGTLQIYLEKFHSYILTQHLVLTDPQVAARVNILGRAYSSSLTDKALIQQQGLAALAKKTTLEANILAYNDIFRLYSIIALALFCLLVIRILLKIYFTRRLARMSAHSKTLPEKAASAAQPA